MKRSTSFLILAIIFIGAVFIIFTLIDQIRIRATIDDYFDALKRNKFEEAFKKVAYFDKYSDVPPVIDYESAKEIWTNRVEGLVDEGILLKNYHSIRVWKDDGYPRGEATIVLLEGEQGIKKYNVSIHLVKFDGHWKVQSIYSSADQNRFEQAVSGYVEPNRK